MQPIKYQVVGEEDYAFVISINSLGEYTVSSGTYTSEPPRSGKLSSTQQKALVDAIQFMQDKKLINNDPIIGHVASVSVGIYNGTPIMDLDYVEDSNCETDMNIVMNDQGGYIEVQGTAEGTAFSPQEFQAMLDLGKLAIDQLIEHQREALAVE